MCCCGYVYVYSLYGALSPGVIYPHICKIYNHSPGFRGIWLSAYMAVFGDLRRVAFIKHYNGVRGVYGAILPLVSFALCLLFQGVLRVY